MTAIATSPEPAQLLTREQAAKYLGIKPQTLAVWATTGRHHIPYIRVGRSVRYQMATLQEWCRSRTVGSNNSEV